MYNSNNAPNTPRITIWETPFSKTIQTRKNTVCKCIIKPTQENPINEIKIQLN